MAWLGIIIIYYMDTQDLAIYHVWIHLFPTSYIWDEKPFGLELEMNPGPLASQATALTTRPCHLRLSLTYVIDELLRQNNS